MPTPRLRQASYRGVVFGVRATEDETSRRLSVDELPGRDLPVVQDWGRGQRILTFDAFTVGADYLDRAAELVGVCAERDTPGKLSLPHFENLVVRPMRCIRRDSEELGMARFQLQFIEVELLPAPMRRSAGLQGLDAAAALVAQAGAQAMADGLQVAQVPNQVLVAAGDEVAKVGGALQSIGAARDGVQAASSLARKASDLVRDAQVAILEPITLAATLQAAFGLVLDTALDAMASLHAYRNLESLRPVVHTTYLQNTNAALVIGAARRCALAGWARSIARVDWPSYEDAVAARLELEEAMDAQAGEVSDAEYLHLQGLRSRLAQEVPQPGKNLPRRRRIVLARTTSSLVLAYRIHDDVSRAEEIAARNKAKHPAFLPQGVELEVLSG